MRSACVLEWLAQHAEVDALVCPEPGMEAGERLFDICRRVEVVRLPFHSTGFAPRAWRNLRRALRGVPPLVDRFFCAEVGDALERLLPHGPYDLAVCEHFWMAPWVHTIRSHATTIILDQHNREPEFYRAVGGPLATWFSRCAERWERDLLPEFDQVWDPVIVPTGLPWRDPGAAVRDFDIAFSASWDYSPNRDGLIWFFKRVWPEILACRPGTTLALIGRHSEAIPTYIGKDRQVTITGPVVDATAWLERAKVAVAPLTRGAGVCVKVVEAWRAGCAMVATSVGARGYEAGEGLIMIDAPSSFATTVLQLLLDAERRQRLARAGRRRFEQEYAWTAVRARMDRQIIGTLALEVMR
jgi:glycosyltransferase involved in cell wall biosynthesis